MKKRYYFHGDRQEGTEDLYYCQACDFFWEREHFFSWDKIRCCGSEKYDFYFERTQRIFKALKKRGYYRPHNPPSIF
jgi:hypothetical protein